MVRMDDSRFQSDAILCGLQSGAISGLASTVLALDGEGVDVGT